MELHAATNRLLTAHISIRLMAVNNSFSFFFFFSAGGAEIGHQLVKAPLAADTIAADLTHPTHACI